MDQAPKRFTFQFSAETAAMLRELAKKLGLSLTSTVAFVVREEAQARGVSAEKQGDSP